MDNIDELLGKIFLVFILALLMLNIFAGKTHAVSSSTSSVTVGAYLIPDETGIVSLNSTYQQIKLTSASTPILLTILASTTDPTINFSSLLTGGSGVIPEMTITSGDLSDILIHIPSTTIYSARAGWSGIMKAPYITTISLPVTAGETKTLSSVFQIGITDYEITFNNAVKITFVGGAGTRVGYNRDSSDFTEITRTCDSATDQAIIDAQLVSGAVDCKINSGSDLIVWTKHFTKFATFTSVATSSTPSSTLAPLSTNTTSTPVCNASKPSTAPVLLPAEAGRNQVTLRWAKAGDPVTKYLVAYGTTSDAMQYGNPYVGDANTTSTTVERLSSGTTYYFKVKAVNDCMPGDFSNIVSSSSITGRVIAPGSSVVEEQPAEGYVPVAELARFLFDIELSIENSILQRSSDLVANIRFSSFGNVPTGVDLVYIITDESGNEVYRDTGNVIVETEQLVTKQFNNLSLVDGKYTLVLSTTYGDDVKDEFRQSFEVKQATKPSLLSAYTIGLIGLLIITLAGIYIRYIHPKKRGAKT